MKGYKEADKESLDYIVAQAVDMMDKRENEFKTFYCNYALHGYFVATCQIKNENCDHLKREAFDKVLSEDLKAHWDNTGKGLVDRMECDYCPNAPGC